MKTSALIIFLVLALLKTQAQDYLISFAGVGDTNVVSSVKVNNLTSRDTITLNGGDILHLTKVVGVDNFKTDKAALKIYPNPMRDQSVLTFIAPENGMVIIGIIDLSGRTVYQSNALLSPGSQSFRISGLNQGMFLVKVIGKNYSYSAKLISESNQHSTARIQLVPASGISTELKSTVTYINMPYTEGDLLLFKSISGQYRTVATDIPTGSKTITFNFMRCKDGDGNNYATVKIGTQTWMAENLKTTKYNDGIEISGIIDNETWSAQTTGAYCWYNNDADTYKNSYGGAYNWFTVNTGKLCPTGWHVPSTTEWLNLMNFLGGTGGAGGKLKESDTLHWKSPNTDANNSSGFTALPGGNRGSSGSFYSITWVGFWWSSNVWWDNINNGTSFMMMYNSSGVNYGSSEKNNGNSVRCIKD